MIYVKKIVMNIKKLKISIFVLLMLFFPTINKAQNFSLEDYLKLSSDTINFSDTLNNEDYFGSSVANLGDLNGDGIDDIAVGSINDDEGGTNRGAIYILFLDTNNSVKSYQKIAHNMGGFGALDNGDAFGSSIANIGDLNGDGIIDIAVGAGLDDDGNPDVGAVYVLFLDTNGTLKNYQKISATAGGFTGSLAFNSIFGSAVSGLGDLDGDGINDIAVGSMLDITAGAGKGVRQGAVWILFLDTNGTVKSHTRIGPGSGGFTGTLTANNRFGAALATIGDLNEDGVVDIAVGANRDADGGLNRGAIWILFMKSDGTVLSHQKISDTAGGFTGTIDSLDLFGSSISSLGDFDGDGSPDLLVGSPLDDDGGTDRGALWLLYLNLDGTVKENEKICDTLTAFSGVISNGDRFGQAVATINNLQQNGEINIAAGAPFDDDGGVDRGAVYIIKLKSPFFVNYATTQETPDTLGSIELTPTSGTAPYYYFWDDGDQSQNRYNLESGLYSVTIVDTLMDSVSLVIPVDVEVQIADSQGVTFNNRYLEKTAAAGWGTGKMSFSNVVKGDGSVRVEIINDNKEWAFGYRLSTDSQAVYYDSLDYGFYINSGDTLYTWNKSTATLTYIGSITAGDILSIERDSGLVTFKKNDVFISEVSVNVNNEYRLDFSMYSNLARIKIFVIRFLYWPRPTVSITHLNCYEGNDGAITLSVAGNVNAITGYEWTIPNSMFTYTTQNISGLVPGAYTLTISYGTSSTIVRTYYVGYEVELKNIVGATTNGNSILKTAANGYTNHSGASSLNILKGSESGWIEFQVDELENKMTVGFADIDSDQQPGTIDYGLQFDYISVFPSPFTINLNVVYVVEGGTPVAGTLASYNTNTVFKLYYNQSSGTVSYFRSTFPHYNWHALTSIFSTVSPQPNKLMFDAALSETNKQVIKINTSFGCPSPGYPILKRKLDAGFFATVKQNLFFQYDEEYNVSGNLNAKIYNPDRTEVASVPVQTITKVGNNYYQMNLSALGLTASEFYVLEVTNSKNEKFLLRFLYQ